MTGSEEDLIGGDSINALICKIKQIRTAI